MLIDGFEYKIASAPDERLAAFRLRYMVFSQEENDYRYADKEKGIYTDVFDNENAILIICKDGYNVVGTLRLIFRKFGPYFGDHLLKYNVLASIFHVAIAEVQEKTMIKTRGVVNKEYRGRGIFSMMDKFAESIGKTKGMKCCIGVVDVNKKKQKQLNLALGFTSYGICESLNGFKGELLYKKI